MNIGQTIKSIRTKSGHTQQKFGNTIGITQTYLSQIEANKKEPSTSLLKVISKEYGIALAIMLWQSIEEKDVAEDKREAFKLLKKPIDELIKEIS